jgi:hypothetical protein
VCDLESAGYRTGYIAVVICARWLVRCSTVRPQHWFRACLPVKKRERKKATLLDRAFIFPYEPISELNFTKFDFVFEKNLPQAMNLAELTIEVVSGADQRSLEVQIFLSPIFKNLGFLEGFVLNFVCKSFFTLPCCMVHLLFNISFFLPP